MDERQIAPGVHGLGSHLVNWYVVEDEGRLTAVDAGLPAFAKTLDADLARLGLARADIEAVVLTHADEDHIGMAASFAEAGVRVLVPADEEERLRKASPKGGDASVPNLLANLWRPMVLKVLGHMLRHGAARPPRLEDAETYSPGDTLDVPGRPRAIGTPGHTRGHCSLLFPSRRVLFAGDALIDHALVTGGGNPQLMPSFMNVDTARALRSLDALAELDGEAELLLFGHGEPWTGGARAAVESARASASR